MIRIIPILLAAFGLLAPGLSDDPKKDQKKQYDAEVPKTILELQAFRETSSIRIQSRAGQARAGKEGVAILVNLNPSVNAWYLLKVVWQDGAPEQAWHLENSKPGEARVLLDEKYPSGLVIAEGAHRYPCDLFGANALELGRNTQLIYYPLCEGRLYLRNPAKGHRTALEATTEFLRDHVWGGEKVIVMFHHLMADRYRATGELETGAAMEDRTGAGERPLTAIVDPQYSGRQVAPANLGIALDQPGTEKTGPEKTGMTPGAWYAAAGNAGVYVSILQPNFIAPAILRSYPAVVNNLDSVEASSLSYLIAFDLDRFDIAYALGTEHPEVNWSEHLTGQVKDARLPGPDGIAGIAPLISTGLIRPDNGGKTVAAFTGGFKRAHGAFRYGDLALKNHGSHYGFIENGVIFSKLQPGLATVFVRDDSSLEMKTWTEADNPLLAGIKHARQNGVAIIDSGIPGNLVNRWGPGNWSGSEDEKLRTIRAGIALQESHGKSFLIYAVFSDATPSAMARVFQAYQCSYAMLLDMNALEHTYLALYRRSGGELSVDHLLKGMSELDKSASNENVPRFLGFSDNRDFFYLMRRAKGGKP